MPKKKTKKKSKPKNQPKPDTGQSKLLLEDCLKYLENEAVNDEWFTNHFEGWNLVNRLRKAIGRPEIKATDMPSRDYFDSDGMA